MSRRIIPQNDSDSLKDEKQKTEALQSQANSAERRVQEAGSALSQIEKDTEKALEKRQHLEDSIEVKKAQLAELDDAVEAKKSELRKVEGELSEAESELVKVRENTQKAQSEHTRQLEVLKADHEATRTKYQNQRAELMGEMSDCQKTIESRKKEAEGLEAVITRYKLTETEFEKNVLPLIPKRKEELEALERELLVKRVEVKKEEDKLAELSGQVAETKREYDEVTALLKREEARVEAELNKLVEKEQQVDEKIKRLRVIKEGVDKETERLKRREADLELARHLEGTKVTN